MFDSEDSPARPEISPDGHRIAVNISTQVSMNIWLLDAVRKVRLTFDAGVDDFPIWSPDGGGILFRSNRDGSRKLYLKSTSAAGPEELVFDSPDSKTPTDWSPDGRFSVERIQRTRSLCASIPWTRRAMANLNCRRISRAVAS